MIPKSGSSLWTDTVVILQTAPNPEGAYSWLNFILQPEVAAKTSQVLTIATPNRAAYEQLPKKIQTNTELFPPENLLQKCESIAPLGTTEEIYNRYWTELTSS